MTTMTKTKPLTYAERRKQMTHAQRIAHRRALEALPFTDDEKERWAPMLHACWQAIGDDAVQAMHEAGQRMTRGIIVELVCDANRMQMYGGMTPEEDDFLGVVYQRPAGQRWLKQVLNY